MTSRRAVAEEAGVSIRTVSNVVAGFERIAPETRERVQRAIDLLGYRPSEFGRGLKAGRSGVVGLMLPELDAPYFAELTRCFMDEGYARGFSIVVDQTNGDIDRERALVTRVGPGGLLDALVFSPLALRHDDAVRLSGGGPVVMLGEVDFPGFDKVMIDSDAAAQRAVEHLVASGARRIAAIGFKTHDNGTGALRFAGYRRALAVAGLPDGAELFPVVPAFTRDAGAEAMRCLLELPERPDAVFAFSDLLATGALRALHEAGVRSPEDILVIGIDNVDEGRFSIPTLSTISPDKTWIARTALDRISRRLAGDDLEVETLFGPFELIARESAPLVEQ